MAQSIVSEMMGWAIDIFLILLVLGIVYTVGRILIVVISPNTDNKIEKWLILRAAKRNFDFLLKKGYKIVDVRYIAHHYGGWHVCLESPDREMSFVLDRELGSLLSLGSEKHKDDCQVNLEAMIYHLTQGQVFIDPLEHYRYSMNRQFRITAGLIKKYYEYLMSYERERPLELKRKLSDIQSKYILLLSQKREQNR